MKLDEEVSAARKGIFRDGYDMSFGELASLYQKGELVIAPEYQRLFRWDSSRKTRFIESLLLTIPIPPIFVFADKRGRWELVDGLQRVSTVLELMGVLRGSDGELRAPFVCDGTSILPALEGVGWPVAESEADDDKVEEDATQLSQSLAAGIRRARIRIEILGQETDPNIKYELFQRLNTGGALLTEQEIRNVIVIAINREAYDKIAGWSTMSDFVELTPLSDERVSRQYRVELATRFIVLRHFPYQNGMDVHTYLDRGMVSIAKQENFAWDHEQDIFARTMSTLKQIGGDVFRKNNRFSLAMYEFTVLGISKYIENNKDVDIRRIAQKIAEIPELDEIDKYSGMGVRGTQRLAGLVMPLAEKHFA